MMTKRANLPNHSPIRYRPTKSLDADFSLYLLTSSSRPTSGLLSQNSFPKELLPPPCIRSLSTPSLLHASNDTIPHVLASPQATIPPLDSSESLPEHTIAKHRPTSVPIGTSSVSRSPSLKMSLPAEPDKIGGQASFTPLPGPDSSLLHRIRHLTLRTALLRCNILSLDFSSPSFKDAHHPPYPGSYPPYPPSEQCTRIISAMTNAALPIAADFDDFPFLSRCWYWVGRAEAGLAQWDQATVAFDHAIKYSINDADETPDLQNWSELARARSGGWNFPVDVVPMVGEPLTWRKKRRFTREEQAYIDRPSRAVGSLMEEITSRSRY